MPEAIAVPSTARCARCDKSLGLRYCRTRGMWICIHCRRLAPTTNEALGTLEHLLASAYHPTDPQGQYYVRCLEKLKEGLFARL